MPTGTMFMHPWMGTLFIKGDDNTYYQPWHDVILPPDTRVTFRVLNFPDAPPGFHYADNVAPLAPPSTQELKGTIVTHPTMTSSLFIKSDDGLYYSPRPTVSLPVGTKVTFRALHPEDAPPGFLFAGDVKAAGSPASTSTGSVPTSPQGTTTTVAPPPTAKGVWGKPLPSSITASTTSTPPNVPIQVTPHVVAPSLPMPNTQAPRTLTNRQTAEDFAIIKRKVEEIDWGDKAGWGPSVQVTTRLKWEGEGIELYMRVLEEYQDKKIPGTRLYYYVGTMGVNWGKGGFRISAHTQPKASIAKSKTRTVLHIEN